MMEPPEPPEDAEPKACPVEDCDATVAGTRVLGWHLMHNHFAMNYKEAESA